MQEGPSTTIDDVGEVYAASAIYKLLGRYTSSLVNLVVANQTYMNDLNGAKRRTAELQLFKVIQPTCSSQARNPTPRISALTYAKLQDTVISNQYEHVGMTDMLKGEKHRKIWMQADMGRLEYDLLQDEIRIQSHRNSIHKRTETELEGRPQNNVS